jgi:FtsZ-interacting cell division protein ZipA
MRIGAGLLLIAVGAILRFGISTVSTHGINLNTIGDILILVGVLGVVLWMVVWAPWTSRRRAVYQRDVPVAREERVYREDPAYRGQPVYREERAVYREDVPADELPPARYEDDYYRR